MRRLLDTWVEQLKANLATKVHVCNAQILISIAITILAENDFGDGWRKQV